MEPVFDWTDRPKQKAFFYDSKNKTIGGGGGYNSGKSHAMIGKIHFLLEIFHGSHAIIGRKTYGALEKSVIPTFEKIALARNGGKWNGPVISKFTDMTAHYTNGSKLWFVTYDDVLKVRGPNIAFAGISQAEEVAHAIFLELKGRCRQWNDVSIAEYKAKHGESLKKQLGFIPTPFNQLICEFNPAPNWVRDEFIFNEHKANKYYDLPTSENKKYHAKGWLDDLKVSYSSEWYNRFVLGSWNNFGGAVFPEFDMENVHGVPEFKIPDHWPRIVGGDYGYRNPTAFIAQAVDEMGNVIAFREYYQNLTTPDEHVAWINEYGKIDKFPVSPNDKYMVHMDYGLKANQQADGRTLWDIYIDKGVALIEAIKNPGSINAYVQLKKSMLLPDPERKFPAWHPKAGQLGSPKYFVMNNRCPNLVNETQTYIWEPQDEGKEKNYQEKPKDWNNHAIDADKYGLLALGKLKAIWLPVDKSLEQKYNEARMALAKAAFEPDPIDDSNFEVY